ncbi:hypothetical protein SAMN02927916_3122 [Flavobacterium anhuiense]|uniref:Uncharacterized protein n=1 Tax=Flavobacterium anhuiense TaxID=459526 RepID=A0ABY0LZX3_9FLAO|nr:hypothetical protein SAMN02927916_3122 [Flavobacterium anhuiense]
MLRNLKKEEGLAKNLQRVSCLKKAWNSAYRTEVLAAPTTISEPTPQRREHLTYPLVVLKTPVFCSRFKANASKYFLLKSRKFNKKSIIDSLNFNMHQI